MLKFKSPREEYLLLKDMPKAVLEFLFKFDGFIMGGAITAVFTARTINDYDIYFADHLALSGFKEQLEILQAHWNDWSALPKGKKERAKRKEGFVMPIFAKLMFQSETADSWLVGKTKIQLMTYSKFIGVPEETWHYYDFTVCMGAYSLKDKEFVLHDDFLAHNAQRRLFFNATTEYSISSLIRVNKYLKKGYVINSIELIKLALAINSLQLSDYRAIKKQLMGIDTLFLKPLTDWLAGKGEEQFDLTEFMNKFEEVILRAYHINAEEAYDAESTDDPISQVTKEIIEE